MITCQIHRTAILRAADTSTPLPQAAAEHLRQCPACRQLHESHTSIAQCLIAGAPAVRREPSPFLHARIMRSLEQSEMATRPAAGFRWMRAIAVASSFAACAILVGILVVRHQPSSQPVNRAGVQPARVGPDFRAVMAPVLARNIKLPSETQVREWSGKIDEPLKTEMQFVVSDAKAAVNSLDNLIPPNVRAKLIELAGN